VVPFLKINELSNFDLVQFVNSNPLTIFKPNQYLYSHILDNSNKSFLSACGDDPIFYENLHQLKYHPYSSLNPQIKDPIPHVTKAQRVIHDMVVDKVDAIIPVLYEYAIGYRNKPKITKTIPLPLSTDEISYQDNIVCNKLRFFHGLNREFFKGTPIIIEALERLKANYPNDVEITIAGKMSLSDYFSVLQKSNVVLDQCKVYSYAMNALYSMSLGKIVMAGSEEVALAELNIPKSDCPVIGIKPDANQIYDELLKLLDQRSSIIDMGYASRKYVETYHDATNIAQQYLDIWNIK
jgi:glycosyltransferase involved in cell wall biosynthesis